MVEISYLDAGLLINIVEMVEEHGDKGPLLSGIVRKCASSFEVSEATVYRRLKRLSDLKLIKYKRKSGAKENYLTFIGKTANAFHNKYRINFNSLKRHYPSLPGKLLELMAIQMAAYEERIHLTGELLNQSRPFTTPGLDGCNTDFR